MLKFSILENGNLRISVQKGFRKEFKQYMKEDKHSNYSKFFELTEGYWANGWGVHNSGDDLGQLSSCLVIAEDSSAEDNGSITLHGRTWTNIHNYCIVDPLEEILEKGFYDFLKWKTFDNENFNWKE